MIYELRTLKNIFAAVVLMSALSIGATRAQETASMAVSELRKEAMVLVEQQKYLEARPYIRELIKRFKDSDDASLKATLEQFYYFEAYGNLQEYANNPSGKLLQEAVKGFDNVINEFPGSEFAISSIKTKATCYEQLNDFETAIKTREILLAPPYADKISARERLDIVKRISITLYNQRKWSLGEKWFAKLFEMSKTIEDKVLAAVAIIQTACDKKNYDEAKKYFPYLSHNTPARCDFGLNYALLTAGDALVKDEKYSDASLFYSMVMDKDTIVSNFKNFVEKANKLAERAKTHGSTEAEDLKQQAGMLQAQLKQFESLPSYNADLMARSARNYLLTDRIYESFWSYWQMIKDFPKHQAIEDFYYAAMVGAFQIGKFDVMYELGQEYLKEFPHGSYEKDVKFNDAQYYLRKKDYDSFFALSKAFVSEYYDEPPYSPNFIFLMGKTWLEQSKFSEIIDTFGEYLKKYPDSSISEPCIYWTGMAFMAKGDFPNAQKIFMKQINDFPVGDYSEDGMYRCGIAAFGASDFPVARDTLEEFAQKYPNSTLLGEVEFFLGDIYANVNEVDIAMKHYGNVEQKTKNEAFINNAYMQGARLLHNVDRYGDEIALMDRYLEKYPKGICSEASYNKAKALELLSRPADALKLYASAVEKYGSNPKDDGVDEMILDYDRMYKDNFGKINATVDFLKKLLSDKNLLNDMVFVPAKRYRYFQDNPLLDKRLYEKFKRDKKFDKQLISNTAPIKSLLENYEAQILEYPKGGTEKVFGDILERSRASKNDTLSYRIMMGLDNIGKPVKVDRMFNDDDLKKASVRTLVWIGKINEKYGPEHARKAFAEAMGRDEYQYAIDILFAHAALEERQKAWDSVLGLYTRITDEYPSDVRSANAMILKGDALAKLGKRDQAVECYELVLRSPIWRGEAHAEALYKLGKISQSSGKADDALMYYDRCYLGFSNCYKWTGKALAAAVPIMTSQGKKNDAKQLCTEFLSNPGNKKSPEYGEIKILNDTL